MGNIVDGTGHNTFWINTTTLYYTAVFALFMPDLDDKGYWNLIESYIESHSDAAFSHSMCPECSDKLYGNEDWYIKIEKDKSKE